MDEKSRNYPPVAISPDPEMRGGCADELIGECVRRVGTLLTRREDLLSRTGIDGEDVEREWSELDVSLDFAISELSLQRAVTSAALASKFECLDLLLETVGPEYLEVHRFKDALLQECRHFVAPNRVVSVADARVSRAGQGERSLKIAPFARTAGRVVPSS